MLKARIEKARERLASEFAKRVNNPDTPEDFSGQVTRACQNLINLTVRELKGNASVEQIIDSTTLPAVRKRLGLTDLEGNYRRAYADREQLLHSVRVEDDADLREKFRFLAFRMVLAVGIAAVVLLTGYVAKVAEIPLPLLRLPG
jgi:hypothetical protein